MNSARNELLRAVRNGSTDEFKQRSVNKIKEMLLSNDFTPSVIERLTREINKDKPPNQTRLRITQYLSLPYVNKYHKRKVYQILRQNDLLDMGYITGGGGGGGAAAPPPPWDLGDKFTKT